MTHYYRRVKCPYCNYTSDVNYTTNRKYMTGTPFRKCPKCGNVYFDSYYKEPAILVYEDSGKPQPFLSFIIAAAISTPAIVLIYVILISGTFPWWQPIIALVLFIMAIVFDVNFILNLIHTFQGKKYLSKYHQRQVDYLDGKRGSRSTEVEQSLQRLSKLEYLLRLQSSGVKVPEYFFNLLNNTSEDNNNENLPSGYKNNTENKFCRYCGEKLPIDSIYCSKCGQKQ